MAQCFPNILCRLNNHSTVCVAITLFLLVPCVATLSFSFPNFDPNNRDIMYNGSAYPGSDATIQLTRNQRDKSLFSSIGGAIYAKPLQLWDAASGRLTDFTTHFSFVIDSQNQSNYGDGLAFFLAPVDSPIPYNANNGGSLGLTSDDQLPNSNLDSPFVAVEFDIFKNSWDPENDHVGIDINSMESVTNTTWWSSITDGKTNNASITYDSYSKNLSVVFTGFDDEGDEFTQHLYYTVNLRDYLPEKVKFGFTAATGGFVALHAVLSWNFNSTLQINDPVAIPPTRSQNMTNPGANEPVASPAPTRSQNMTNPGANVPEPSPPTKSKSKSKTGLVIGLIIGGSVLVGGSVLLLCQFRRRSGRGDYEGDAGAMFEMPEFESPTGPKRFSYTDLATATRNFADQEKLGEGGFGGVYKGYLSELNAYVAVKKISRDSNQGVKEYASEVKIISRLRHRNLVQLIGWCHEKSELLLVYEYMSNGSLDSHLFKGKSLLTWEIRYKIVKGIASALLYLHEEWEQCVVHRDIKSSNVMLDSTFNAKLGDFGLARLVDHEKGSQTTMVAGTMGYMAPECVITGKASKETDVYSFGVVALEIACGRRSIEPKAPTNQVMVEWVWSLYGAGKILEAADPKLSSNFNEQEIENLMIVGLWCAHPDSNSRPSIREASRVLNFEALLPFLPSRMPVPTYGTPPVLNMASSSSTSSYGTIVSQRSQILSSVYSTDSSKFNESS